MKKLIANGLVKTYQQKTIVDQVDLEIADQEVVGLLGPNGAGKTTSFNMIIGLIRLDRGSISLNGNDISRLPMHERARAGIGYLPQEHSIFRKLSTEDNILAVLEAAGKLDAEQRHEKTSTLLEEFGITHLKDNMAIQLSGGEQRRVEIARALALEPDFILLDEPFAGIDPIAVKDIQTIIRLLKQRGVGVLITDHNVRETMGICDRAYILVNGKVLVSGPPATVLHNHDARELYLGHDFSL